MPVKKKNIIYNQNFKKYDSEKIIDYTNKIELLLGLTRKPVGVKLFLAQNEYDEYPFEEKNDRLAYCCVVEKATRGRSCKTTLLDSYCDGGTTALYTEESTERIESGLEYFSYDLYSTPAVARRVRDSVPGLYRKTPKTYGIAVAPLSEFKSFPDIIIFIGNPYQIMRLQQGDVFKEGTRLFFEGAAMQAICAEITVQPYLTGKMNVSPLCPSTRFLAKWKDEEMAVGIPFERFIDIVDGVLATMNTTDTDERKIEIQKRFDGEK